MGEDWRWCPEKAGDQVGQHQGFHEDLTRVSSSPPVSGKEDRVTQH